MPTGVITFQRYVLPSKLHPRWADSKKGLCDTHLTTGKKIEDIYNALQVDFANKYIVRIQLGVSFCMSNQDGCKN